MVRYIRKLLAKQGMARVKELTRGMQKLSMEDGEAGRSFSEDPESEGKPMTELELAHLIRTQGLDSEDFDSDHDFPEGFSV